MILLLCFFVILIAVPFALLFSIYVYPYIREQLLYAKNKRFRGTDEELEKIIFKTAYAMAFSKKNLMSMHELSDFKTELFKAIFGKHFSNEGRFFFPRAFLFYSLFSYTRKKCMNKEFDKLKECFINSFMNSDGTPTFKVDRVDQAVFGLSSNLLYLETKDPKFKIFSDYFYQYLLSNTSREGIIVYRKNTGLQHVDALGMIVPFLISYAETFSVNESMQIAFANVSFYMKYGIDSNTGLPFHAFNLISKQKQGPMNWGRGIVWYYLSLLFIKKSALSTRYRLEKVDLAIDKIEKFLSYSEYPYAQFIGLKFSSVEFDTSVFSALAYIHKQLFNLNIDYSVVKEYVTSKGLILFSSGDTLGINNYARVSSPSEFSQAMLLMSFVKL